MNDFSTKSANKTATNRDFVDSWFDFTQGRLAKAGAGEVRLKSTAKIIRAAANVLGRVKLI